MKNIALKWNDDWNVFSLVTIALKFGAWLTFVISVPSVMKPNV